MPASKPLTLTVLIESLNAGMRTRDDVAACLEDAAAKLREFACTPRHITASLRDVNGNTVGHLTLRNAVEPDEVDGDVV